MATEYIVHSTGINQVNNPELTINCRCGITVRTKAHEYICPLCNTLLIQDGKIHSYRFNRRYYEEIIEEVEREMRKRVA